MYILDKNVKINKANLKSDVKAVVRILRCDNTKRAKYNLIINMGYKDRANKIEISHKPILEDVYFRFNINAQPDLTEPIVFEDLRKLVKMANKLTT